MPAVAATLGLVLPAGHVDAGEQELFPGIETGSETIVGPGSAADPLLTEWRRTKTRNLWNTVYPGAPISDSALDDLLAGKLALPGEISRHGAFYLSGSPRLPLSPAGVLLAGLNDRFWPVCSVVLTRPDTALTARHCLAGRAGDRPMKVYFPYEGIRDVAPGSFTTPCGDIERPCPSDLAAFHLTSPYRFIPLATQAAQHRAGPGTSVLALGYGPSNPALADSGLLHGSPVLLDNCQCGDKITSPKRQRCFAVRTGASTAPLQQFANLQGDSGGPMFAPGDDHALVGIANGIERNCHGKDMFEGRYADVRKAPERDWLAMQFCEKSCPERPVPNFRVLLQIDLAYSGENVESGHAIDLPAGTSGLTITLNHEVHGFHPEPGADLELLLPPTLDGECFRYHGVEACTIRHPAPGQYMIGVRAMTGNPAYQLAVVSISGE